MGNLLYDVWLDVFFLGIKEKIQILKIFCQLVNSKTPVTSSVQVKPSSLLQVSSAFSSMAPTSFSNAMNLFSKIIY